MRLRLQIQFLTDPSITIKRGSYDSPEFLASAFAGIDAVVLVLNFRAVPEMESKLIEEVAAAGVKWIFPTEFGSDTGNETMINAVPLIHTQKVGVRKRIEELAEVYRELK